MYSRWQIICKYLHYYLTASNGKGHGTHSPFIFNFITRVLNDIQHYEEYDIAEKLREDLLRNSQTVNLLDYGAGSSVAASQSRTVSSIARHSAKSKKYGRLLFRLVRNYQPSVILELGTSLGITTTYLSLAHSRSRLITVEGAPEIAGLARSHFEKLQLGNITLVEGPFDQVLPGLMNGLPGLDFCFIDGNHQYGPTLDYFHQMLPSIHNDTILVFDDIHWSEGMEKAWAEIRNHEAVRCSVDLFFSGIVFFRDEFREKQHFRIRF